MATTALSDMLPVMRPILPDCPVNVIQQALQHMSTYFHVETEAYRVEDTQDTVANQRTYTVTIPTNYEVRRITELRILSADEVTNGEEGTLIDPQAYEFQLPDTIYFPVTAPTTEAVTNGFVVEMALAPNEDSATIDADFLDHWNRYIRAGALWYLFNQANRVWSDPNSAVYYERLFKEGIGMAKREALTRFTARPFRIETDGWLDS